MEPVGLEPTPMNLQSSSLPVMIQFQRAETETCTPTDRPTTYNATITLPLPYLFCIYKFVDIKYSCQDSNLGHLDFFHNVQSPAGFVHSPTGVCMGQEGVKPSFPCLKGKCFVIKLPSQAPLQGFEPQLVLVSP